MNGASYQTNHFELLERDDYAKVKQNILWEQSGRRESRLSNWEEWKGYELAFVDKGTWSQAG